MTIEKVENLVTNLHDKTEYVINIRNLKQVVNPGLILKKVHRVIQFSQKAWRKPYIDMNTNLRQKIKIILKNIFSSWWIMQVLEKLWKMWGNIEILKL